MPPYYVLFEHGLLVKSFKDNSEMWVLDGDLYLVEFRAEHGLGLGETEYVSSYRTSTMTADSVKRLDESLRRMSELYASKPSVVKRMTENYLNMVQILVK